MRVSEMLQFAEMSRANFQNLRFRGLLPFEPVKDDGWHEYSEESAKALRTMGALIGFGLPRELSKQLVGRDNGDAERVLAILRGQA